MYARKRKYLGEWSEAAWIIHERSASAYCLPLRWWLDRSRTHARLIIYFYNMCVCVCVWHEIHDTPNWEFARVSEDNFYLLFYVTVAAVLPTDETYDVRLLYGYDYCKRTTVKPNIIVIYVSNTQQTVDIYYNIKLYHNKIIYLHNSII